MLGEWLAYYPAAREGHPAVGDGDGVACEVHVALPVVGPTAPTALQPVLHVVQRIPQVYVVIVRTHCAPKEPVQGALHLQHTSD